jgi:hypothetical protein
MSASCLIVFMVALPFAGELPESLPQNISGETAFVSFISSNQWKEVGYRGITKRMTDAIIDDLGNIHIVTDEWRRQEKHTWSYILYDKIGNKVFEKTIYEGNYLLQSHTMLVSRLLLNPDRTVLVFYPDTAFYTCWVKVNEAGEIIEKHEPRWWRGDAGYRVCSAGQDSFHIVTFPVPFWGQLTPRSDPVFGDYYEGYDQILIVTLSYSNNFFLKEKRIGLEPPYVSSEVPRMIALPDNRIFCFSNLLGAARLWTMDNLGDCYEVDQFRYDKLPERSYSHIAIDDTLSQLSVDLPMNPRMDNLAYRNDTVYIGVLWQGTVYLLKYDRDGKLQAASGNEGSFVEIGDLDHEQTFPFIAQIIAHERLFQNTGELDKSIFYWGFDIHGRFFLQIY